MSIRKQCELLNVHRSNLYYKPRPKLDDNTLMNEIHEIWLDEPSLRYRKIHRVLKDDKGYQINRKKVQRLMREMNLKALYPKPRTSIKDTPHEVYPYLLKDLEVTKPNQVWAVDITYLRVKGGFVYLVVFIDLCKRMRDYV